MASTAHQLENKRKKFKDMAIEMETKTVKIDHRREEILQLKERLLKISLTTMTSEQRVNKLSKILENEEKFYNVLTLDACRIQNNFARHEEELFKLTEIVKLKECEIDNLKRGILTAKKELIEFHVKCQRKREIAYNAEYRRNLIETKLYHLENTDTGVDALQNEQKIKNLTDALDKHMEVKNLLQKEVVRLEDEMRRLTLSISTDSDGLTALRGKLQDQVLLFEGGVKHVAAAKLKSQERHVEHNMLRLKIDNFERAIKKQEGKLYNLQQFRIDLDCAMSEKQITVTNNLEILKVKRRSLQEEIHRLKCDIMNRNIRIEQFQKKHHLALMSLGKDDDGNPLSITHVKIKNAQEKYMLVSEGDELDTKIKKMESEIIAMENTVKIINSTNSSYKNSLAPVTEDDAEAAEMKHYETMLFDLTDSVRSNKRTINNIQAHIEDLQNITKDALSKRDNAKDLLEECTEMYDKLKREDEERNQKLQRAENQLKQISKRISESDIQKYQKDSMIRQMQDANNSALQQLTEMSLKIADIEPMIGQKIAQYGLSLPGHKSKSSLTVRVESPSTSSLSSTSSSVKSVNSKVTQVTLSFDTCELATCAKSKSKSKSHSKSKK